MPLTGGRLAGAITDGLVPDGHGLRHTGRDRGDLVIRLVSLDEETTHGVPLPTINVPETLSGCHETLKALRDTPGLLDVSNQVRQRALRISQAIADECARRGYRFGLRDDGDPSFRITVGEERFRFTLSEEFERREVVGAEKSATAKYEWQRIPSEVRPARSGRLILRLGAGYGSVSWADRQRWTLDQKLPQMFGKIAGLASTQAESRHRREEERRQRRLAWDQAIPRAEQAYLDHLNQNRLRKQTARSAEAEAIRDYCMRLDRPAKESTEPGMAEQIRKWAAWARQEADRVDPVEHPDKLTYVVPSEVRPADIDKFMPDGLNAWSPPD